MNARRLVTLTLILTLPLVCLLNHSPAGVYPEGTFDFESLAATSTLTATHLIVGEVIHVSFVFDLRFTGSEYGPDGWATSGPLSIVTLRVDKDMKEAIIRAENDDKAPSDKEEQLVSFVQTGGPYPDGDYVEAAGIRLLKNGDYVFLRLIPSAYPVTNNGVTVDSCTEDYGTMYTVEEKGNDDIDQHIIKHVWKRLDISVGDMTRIVRATLKAPEEMRTFERATKRTSMTKDTLYETLMLKVKNTEAALSLPELKSQ